MIHTQETEKENAESWHFSMCSFFDCANLFKIQEQKPPPNVFGETGNWRLDLLPNSTTNLAPPFVPRQLIFLSKEEEEEDGGKRSEDFFLADGKHVWWGRVMSSSSSAGASLAGPTESGE